MRVSSTAGNGVGGRVRGRRGERLAAAARDIRPHLVDVAPPGDLHEPRARAVGHARRAGHWADAAISASCIASSHASKSP